MRRPSFLGQFINHVELGEWVTCRDVAVRMNPGMDGAELSEVAKDFSRRLSNLERYGHIQRRPGGGSSFVYARLETQAVRVLSKAFWFPT